MPLELLGCIMTITITNNAQRTATISNGMQILDAVLNEISRVSNRIYIVSKCTKFTKRYYFSIISDEWQAFERDLKQII